MVVFLMYHVYNVLCFINLDILKLSLKQFNINTNYVKNKIMKRTTKIRNYFTKGELSKRQNIDKDI